MKKLALVIASLSIGSVMASEPNYNYVQGSILKAEEVTVLPGVDVKMEGYSFDYSHELNDRLYGFIGYATADDTVFGAKFEADRLQAGVGLRFPINSSTDFFTTAALLRDKSKVTYLGQRDSDTDNGYGVSVGIRSMVTDAVELSASYTHDDVVDTDNYLTVSGQYFFNENFSLGVSHIDDNDGDMNSVFVRYSF